MRNYFIICCLFVCTLSLIGCNKQPELRYEECHFAREEYYENWVVESCEGVSAEMEEASANHLAVKLHNSLEHDVELQSWSRVFVYRDSIWYAVLPPKDIATSEEGHEKTAEEKEADTIPAGDIKVFVCNFAEMYQGAVFVHRRLSNEHFFSISSFRKTLKNMRKAETLRVYRKIFEIRVAFKKAGRRNLLPASYALFYLPASVSQ